MLRADQWFEEEQPIHVHPKDPYKRVDILPSMRKITVKVDGVLVAESLSNMFLFETLLRPRYYLPKSSVSDHRSSAGMHSSRACKRWREDEVSVFT